MLKEDQQSTWADRIEEFKASGQRVRKWCKANSIKPYQLRYRLKKRGNLLQVKPKIGCR